MGEVRYGGGIGEGGGVMASVCYLVYINIKTNSGKTCLGMMGRGQDQRG